MQLKGFMVSIRLSIITLFVLLLGLIGFAIMFINYRALNQILGASEKNLIIETTLLLNERIHNYLHPLNRDLQKMKNLLKEKIIDPIDPKEFDKYLLESIRDTPQLFMIYYGTKEGDFYGVDRTQKNIIGLNHILNTNVPPIKERYEYNEKGQLVETVTLHDYDPRLRPWYLEAEAIRKPTWTNVYQFVNFGNYKSTVYGVTAAIPVYNKNDKFIGVFAMDLSIEGIQTFINQLNLTQNSLIYVTDNSKQVIAYRIPHEKRDLVIDKNHLAYHLKKLDIPSSILNKTTGLFEVSSFKHEGEEYFLIHRPIMESHQSKPWYITIIVPASDVLAPLRTLRLHTLLWTACVLLLGILIARIFSQRISKPIIQIANEAQQIARLEIQPRPPIKTLIKEINYMDTSLTHMQSSLLSFQRYVPSSLVKQLILSGKIAEMGGERQEITVLFSDIKNFTNLTEQSRPEQLITYLSNYFQAMTEAVIVHEGILDKYIGDAIMALWNAPLSDPEHAFHACQTAIDMAQRLKLTNQLNQQNNFPLFHIRIGINSGEAIVGNVGSEERLSYTALGDTVNVASRLEAVNKLYHTQVIVSESTFKQVADQFNFRLLDEVAVRGKRESTRIYELITDHNIQNLEQYKATFTKAFGYYQQGEWLNALNLFETLSPVYPDDQLASVYIKRCQAFLEAPVSEWDGIWRLGGPGA
ncbi:adenylate/guanylate cyclase domain-containing protein [Legionella quinlivanii]|uniref:adenylate/guanylate cyclase domain-containing protein n=1 Tax=Legionella quinlivanii TaxID=45073 RepID=UPI002244E57A|nr:adenylate/guanylate cyclase domain-containing protein [Legionella quinlivanii]MCW8451464.1 cache domain-containing protein [Legionella quinlivanii]